MPDLSDGNLTPFDELFALFSRTQLLSSEYIEQLAPQVPALRRTFDQLGRGGGTLFRSLVVRRGGQIAGHVSVVRAYSRTWFVQHLAADPGPFRAPYLLNMGAAELFAQLSDVEFF